MTIEEYSQIKKERNISKQIIISRRVIERIYWDVARVIPISNELETPYFEILEHLASKLGFLLGFSVDESVLTDAFYQKKMDEKRDDENLIWRPRREFYTLNQLLSIFLNKKEINNILNRLNNLNNILWYPEKKEYYYEELIDILIFLRERENKKRNK